MKLYYYVACNKKTTKTTRSLHNFDDTDTLGPEIVINYIVKLALN